LLPQSVNMLGGYRVQGKTPDAAESLIADGRAVAAAGASLVVVECVPRDLGAALTQALAVPVIGIGAGPACSGQVLVIYDALGVTTGRPARFVRNFMLGQTASKRAHCIRCRGQGRIVSGSRALLLETRGRARARRPAVVQRSCMGIAWISSTLPPRSRTAWEASSESPSCPRWATCMRVICRFVESRVNTAMRW
jgi:hypothetical protein